MLINYNDTNNNWYTEYRSAEYAVRVNNPFAVYLVFEGSLRWANSEMISEGLSGWLVTYGGTMLEQQEDGSWVGTTSCHTFG